MRHATLALLLSCAAPQAQRETARATVIALAEATRLGDLTCATVATNQGLSDRAKAKATAERCADAYDAMRPSLLLAAAKVDDWDAGRRLDVVCSVLALAEPLSNVASAIRNAGGKVPTIIEDAIKLTRTLGECR